jgi:hypothetical protein
MTNVINHAKETTSISGTGPYSLDGAVSPFSAFVTRASEDIGGASPWSNVAYMCTDNSGNWEMGEGQLQDLATDTLSRLTIHASSNAGGLVNWPDTTAKDIYSWAPGSKLSGLMVQQQRGINTAHHTINTGITLDASAPTDSEGDQIMNLSITPTNANNIIVVEFNVGVVDIRSSGGSASAVISIFGGSTNLAAGFVKAVSTEGGNSVSLKSFFTAGVTTAITIQARAGTTGGTTPTLYLNSTQSGNFFGDAAATYYGNNNRHPGLLSKLVGDRLRDRYRRP